MLMSFPEGTIYVDFEQLKAMFSSTILQSLRSERVILKRRPGLEVAGGVCEKSEGGH